MQSTQTNNILNKLFKFKNSNSEDKQFAENSDIILSEEFKQIRLVIENDVKPYIKSHGGKITLLKVEDNCVFLNLDGACRNCPAIQLTLKGFVERVIKDKFPEVKQVILQKRK
ncbi:MAG TPA: NifU family protein [Candidatus Kapabacteria bacterium]|jgi:Fe-S cluster biogenesis protein NfuA|nr:NifU family protein [Candidatus Kapabacteria bacterium]HOV92630.1 NifU family protein [Candidatus Kapabacteria bacterium]